MSNFDKDNKSYNELIHGKKISQADPELIWGWKTSAGRRRVKRRAQLITESAKLSKGMLVLEIGCGTGVFTQIFAASGAKIVAVDISKELLDLAMEKQLPEEQVQFLEKRFEDCADIGPFDAVIGSSILHHLDIESALKKIYQLLKPEGMISFTEPNMLNPQIALQKNIPWIKKRMGDSPDETAFFRWRIRNWLENAGFINVQTIPFDWLHPATPAKLISAIEKTGLFLEKIPIIRAFAGSLLINAKKQGKIIN